MTDCTIVLSYSRGILWIWLFKIFSLITYFLILLPFVVHDSSLKFLWIVHWVFSLLSWFMNNFSFSGSLRKWSELQPNTYCLLFIYLSIYLFLYYKVAQLVSLRHETRIAYSSVLSWYELYLYNMINAHVLMILYTDIAFLCSDGFFFAVKEVSLLDQGNNAKQCILQLEQVLFASLSSYLSW